MSAANPLVIAVDASTTAAKAVVVDATGQVLATGRAQIDLQVPGVGRYEHDPVQWWRATATAVAEAVGALRAGDRHRVATMCLTHQRETFVALNADGTAIRPAILWLDSRAADQIRRLGSEQVHALSGKPADTTPALYKMAWLAEHEPEVFQRAERVVDVHAYLTHRLTGDWVSSTASADSLSLFDIAALDYAPQLLDLAGVHREQMADLAPPGSSINAIDPHILGEWGIDHEVQLVAGLGDGQAAGLGTAAITPQTAYLNVGTSIVAGVHTEQYQFGRAYRTLAAGMPDSFVLEAVQNSGSHLTDWFRETFGDPARAGQVDPELESAAAQVNPGAEGLLTLPYWNAVQSPHWDPLARGVMFGFTSQHTRAHAYRSILEGTGYELRQNLRGLEHGSGASVQTLRATGGGSRSPLWSQILADVTGVPIVASGVEEVSAQGAAMVAMAGAGGHRDIASAALAMTSTGVTTEPDPDRHARYAQFAEVQAELFPRLAELFEQLADVSGPGS